MTSIETILGIQSLGLSITYQMCKDYSGRGSHFPILRQPEKTLQYEFSDGGLVTRE
jgi:hypothetical protein